MKWLVSFLLSLLCFSLGYAIDLQSLEKQYSTVLNTLQHRGVIWKQDTVFLKNNTNFELWQWEGTFYTVSKKIVIFYDTWSEKDFWYEYLLVHELGHYVQFTYADYEFTGSVNTEYCKATNDQNECYAEKFWLDYLERGNDRYFRNLSRKYAKIQ